MGAEVPTFDQLPILTLGLQNRMDTLEKLISDKIQPPTKLVRMTEKEAADYLGLSVETLKVKARSGEVPNCKTGQNRVYYLDMLQEYERAHIIKKNK